MEIANVKKQADENKDAIDNLRKIISELDMKS